MRPSITRSLKEGAEILSVSTDTEYAHKAWHDSSPSIRIITYPMIADPTAKLCREFGTYLEEEGLSFEEPSLVDPDGVVKAIELHDRALEEALVRP